MGQTLNRQATSPTSTPLYLSLLPPLLLTVTYVQLVPSLSLCLTGMGQALNRQATSPTSTPLYPAPMLALDSADLRWSAT